MSFQTLLLFTVLESIPAVSICFINFGFNALWLWVRATPETLSPSFFAAHMTQGYGFWASAWAIAAYVVSTSHEEAVRKRFARLSAVLYLAWWPLWWHCLFNTSTWHVYVVVLYGIVRGSQALGYTYYALIGSVGGSIRASATSRNNAKSNK